MNENFSDELDFECDRVRFAKFNDEELDEQMKNHFAECEKCRTFFEQSAVMEKELGALGISTFTRNGKSVADSVMEEIKRQKILTRGTPVKESNGIFRHFGLIAACLIIAVMALPVMDSVFGTKKQNAELARDISTDDAGVDYAFPVNEEDYQYFNFGEWKIETEVSEESLANEAAGGGGGSSAAPINNDVVWVLSEAPEADSDNDYSEVHFAEKALYDVYENGASEIAGELEEAAYLGALSYLETGNVPVRESMVITFAGENLAYAVFETDRGEKVTVSLEKTGKLWVVSSVCDGDITE